MLPNFQHPQSIFIFYTTVFILYFMAVLLTSSDPAPTRTQFQSLINYNSTKFLCYLCKTTLFGNC